MTELLWLLLPIAAASGWLIARREYRDKPGYSRAAIAPDYFKGLTYLLNEQPDKAIEVFIRMVEVDTETVETHLALGNLFRRRGEVDRAIRIHQNLIARTTLDKEQRTYALLELGLDYMRAGLLDRAESLFLELLELREQCVPALRELVDIYQQEKDWDKAIAAVRRLEAACGKSQNGVIAQYYCELADAARRAGDLKLARGHLEQALAHDRNCVRASLMEGHAYDDEGDWEAAIRAFQRVEHQDPAYLSEAIAPMLRCYRALGDAARMMPYLRTVWHRYRVEAAMLGLAELIREEQGDGAAADFVAGELRNFRSARGFYYLVELKLTADERARADLQVFRGLAQQFLAERPAHKCGKCGFSGKTLHWQCPTCKSWSSMRPVLA